MGPLGSEIVERFQRDAALRARFGEVMLPDDAAVHVVELGSRQLAIVSVRTDVGPVVLASGPPLKSGASDWWADVEHVATLRSGAELWAVIGSIDLLTWARDAAPTPTDRRRVGLALLQLGETLHRGGVRHGAVEGATVVISPDGSPALLPWSHDRGDDRARLQALGVSVLGSAVDRSLGRSFGTLGLLRSDDLTTPGVGERWSALRALSGDRRAPPDLRFALERGLDSLVRVCGDADASSVLDADVRFSAFHPTAAARHDWTRLLVLAHHGGQVTDVDGDVVEVDELVERSAREQFGPDADLQRSGSAHSLPVERDEQLTFTVHCADADVEAPSQSIVWTGPVEEAVFWLHPHAGAPSMDGSVEIYVGAFVRGRIPFSIPVGVEASAATSRSTVDAYRDVFVSYAHEDRSVVDALTRLNTLGDRFLIDAQELRAGQDWRARLTEMIGEAEVFQLFWSTASASSAEVEVEWRQALDLRHPTEFVRPVYWELPLPAVPEPLSELHFDFVPLGGGGAPLLAAPAVPPMRGEVPAAAPVSAGSPSGKHHPRRDGHWLQSFTRVAMVFVALFGFGAVFAGLVFNNDAGNELSEGPFFPSTTASPSTTPPDSLPPTSGSTPPSTAGPTTPPSTAGPTTPPRTSTSTTSQSTTSSSTDPGPPPPTVDASLGGPIEGTVDSSRYPIAVTVGNGPVTIESIAATDRDGGDVTVIAPELPLTLEVGTTVIDVDLAIGAGAVGEITLSTDVGPVVVSDLL